MDVGTKLYVICPTKVSVKRLLKNVENLRVMGYDVSYWDRSTKYSSADLEAADKVVVMTGSNSWNVRSRDQPSGTASEISTAYKMQKEFYLAYRPGTHTEDRFYEATASNVLSSENSEDVLIHLSGVASSYLPILKSETVQPMSALDYVKQKVDGTSKSWHLKNKK